jgi:UDP-2,3-diacylglucosamine hydrolase
MATLLISDLHLDPSRSAALEAFERLCAGPAREVSDLYILGDLFEAWIGDDEDSPLADRVTAALAALSSSGVRIAFQHGNRDFLLGKRFAARCGMRLLPEAAVERIEGQPTLLLHGDTLCLDDTAYLAFRAQVRDAAWQSAFLARPLAERRAFAAAARAESARHTAGTAPVLMDVAPRAVVDALRVHRVWRMVHGHTHRPAQHAFGLDGLPAERCVLPDWYDSAAGLRADGDDLRFVGFD